MNPRGGAPGDRVARARFMAGSTLAVLAATAASATALWPVYQSGAFVLLVLVAALLGSGITILGALRRWPVWRLVLATIAAYFVVGVPLAVPGQAVYGVLPSLSGLAELAGASALSWKQLVTIVLPVGSYQSLLVPALILVLLCSVAGLSIALRSRTPEFALGVPVLFFVAGLALGPSTATWPTFTGLTLFVVLVGWLLWLNWERRRNRLLLLAPTVRVPAADRRAATARAVLAAAVALLVAASVGALAVVALPPSATRDVLRTRVVAPFDARAYPSPLTSFRGYLQAGAADSVLFRVQGLPAGGRIRLATLDDYNGVVYSVGTKDAAGAGTDSGTFTRLPYRLDQSALHGDEVTLIVSIDAYTGVWVPGAGALEHIEFFGADAATLQESFVYNDPGGTGVVVAGLGRGDSYTSTAIVPTSPAALADAVPGSAVLPPVGVVPDGLAETLAGYLEPGESAGQQLQAMLDSLATNGYISHGSAGEPVSRSGHGADRISELVLENPMLGDAEQYAVAAALMARQIGFPARVVMGFIPKVDETGAVDVTGADVSAWVEVQTRDDGWVTVDPVPMARAVPERQPDDPTRVPRPQTVLPPPPPETADDQTDPVLPESTSVDPPAAEDPFWAIVRVAMSVLAWSLTGLALLAAPFLGIVAIKWWRRRRRRLAATPIERILGGWREFADTVGDYRITVPPLATRGEIARSVGGARAGWLASAVDRAAFAPDVAADTQGEDVWVAVRELAASLHDTHTRRARLLAAISMASFGRYSKRTAGQRGRRGRMLGRAGRSRKETGL